MNLGIFFPKLLEYVEFENDVKIFPIYLGRYIFSRNEV